MAESLCNMQPGALWAQSGLQAKRLMLDRRITLAFFSSFRNLQS